MRKYELTDETYELNSGTMLFRIRALKNFNDVKKGDLGGFVQGGHNLSHEGQAWVYNNAKVFGNAQVYDNASIRNEAKVGYNAKVSGFAHICGQAKIYDNAKVSGMAVVSGSFIQDNAIVEGRANIRDRASVSGNARVAGVSLLSGMMWVGLDAELIYESDVIHFSNVKFGDNTDISDITVFSTKSKQIGINACCFNTRYFSGNEKQFLDFIQQDLVKNNKRDKVHSVIHQYKLLLQLAEYQVLAHQFN